MTENDISDIFADLPARHLLRVDEVAKFMGVTKRTVRNWYPELLKGINIKGIIRIYRQSVVELVVSNNGKKKTDEDPEDIERKIEQQEPRKAVRRRSFVKDW